MSSIVFNPTNTNIVFTVTKNEIEFTVGYAGRPGIGIPDGGDTDQVLYKVSSDNFDTGWKTLDFNDHLTDYNNPHHVTKGQVGLGEVDNTSDADKPISDAVQVALNDKADLNHTHAIGDLSDVDTSGVMDGYALIYESSTGTWEAVSVGAGIPTRIDDLEDVDTSTNPPSVDDILRWDGTNWVPDTTSLPNHNVLSGRDAADAHPMSAISGLVTELSKKAYQTSLDDHTGNTSNPHAVTKAQVGLGNVDNTSDLDKPISTATQTALDGKADSNHTHALNDISDVDTSGATDGQVLSYDAGSSEWVPADGGSGGAQSIDDLTDVDTSTNPPASGNILAWDGTNWVPEDNNSGTPVYLNDLQDVDTSDVSAVKSTLRYNDSIGKWEADRPEGIFVSYDFGTADGDKAFNLFRSPGFFGDNYGTETIDFQNVFNTGGHDTDYYIKASNSLCVGKNNYVHEDIDYSGNVSVIGFRNECDAIQCGSIIGAPNDLINVKDFLVCGDWCSIDNTNGDKFSSIIVVGHNLHLDDYAGLCHILIGQNNEISIVEPNDILHVGDGVSSTERATSFIIKKSGLIFARDLDIATIENYASKRVMITREYFEDKMGEISFNDLSDVAILNPTTGDTIVFNGTSWENSDALNYIPEKVEWAGSYTDSTIYARNDMVEADGWVAIANTETSDPVIPVPEGTPTWHIADDPTFDSVTNAGGITYGFVFTVPEVSLVDAIRIWCTNSTNRYEVTIWNYNLSSTPILLRSHTVEPGTFTENEWHFIDIEDGLLRRNDTIAVSVYAHNTAGDVTKSDEWTLDNSRFNPGTGEFKTDTSGVIEINEISENGTDWSTDMGQVAENDTIKVVDKGNSHNWIEYRVTGAGTDDGAFWSIPVEVYNQNGTLSDGIVCTLTLTVKSNEDVNYVKKDDCLDPNKEQYGFQYNGNQKPADVTLTKTCYGADIRKDTYTASPDWDFVVVPNHVSKVTDPGDLPSHNDLIGRSEDNAHPISAITDLQTELDSKASAIDELSDVNTGAKVDNNMMKWDDTNSEWVQTNAAVAEGTGQGPIIPTVIISADDPTGSAPEGTIWLKV